MQRYLKSKLWKTLEHTLLYFVDKSLMLLETAAKVIEASWAWEKEGDTALAVHTAQKQAATPSLDSFGSQNSHIYPNSPALAMTNPCFHCKTIYCIAHVHRRSHRARTEFSVGMQHYKQSIVLIVNTCRLMTINRLLHRLLKDYAYKLH